jgi:hypothetical protein
VIAPRSCWRLLLVPLGVSIVAVPGLLGASERKWPDTSSRIGVFADQFGRALSSAQERFVATHFAGSQKLTLKQSRPLRALNPNFIVLHYHLALWQSAPATTFITDGLSWANDYSFVATHESWFWHNPAGERVTSRADGKILMNIADPGFRAYWAASIAEQAKAGDYDGVFFDSASPALLPLECAVSDGRLAGTAAKDTAFAELGGKTWIRAWEEWIAELTAQLNSGASHVPLIPNVDGLVTTWDNTNYRLASGIFVEGFADPAWPVEDWRTSTNAILAQASAGRIVILENYLSATDDVARRRYYLANYLLVKGRRTYVDYFSSSPLQWFPEWDLDLGPAAAGPAGVEAFAVGGVYRREFANGLVLVNPTGAAVTVALGTPMRRVEMAGGGDIPEDGRPTSRITTTEVTSITVAAKSGEVLLRSTAPYNADVMRAGDFDELVLQLANRTFGAEEAQEYLDRPMSDAEREEILALARWFQRRYPTPLERLAYVRRAYGRWQRTRSLA